MCLITFSLLLISLTCFRKRIVIANNCETLAFFIFVHITYFFIYK